MPGHCQGPDNSHKRFRQNRTNLRHFGPRGLGSDGQNNQLGWCKSDPGLDKEARQRPSAWRSSLCSDKAPWPSEKFWRVVGHHAVGNVCSTEVTPGWIDVQTNWPYRLGSQPGAISDKNWGFLEILVSNIIRGPHMPQHCPDKVSIRSPWLRPTPDKNPQWGCAP